VTHAFRVTGWLIVEGFGDAVKTVVVGSQVTVCVYGAEVLGASVDEPL
jgi:hypothetical protein